MKIKVFIIFIIFIICFPIAGLAKDELVMEKELMYWAINAQSGDSACFQLIYIEVGRDVPDMRDEQLDANCSLTDGKYSLTLTGPLGTTVTFFGKYNFKKGNGFLTIKKKFPLLICAKSKMFKIYCSQQIKNEVCDKHKV